MSDRAPTIFSASDDFITHAHIDAEGYAKSYEASIADPTSFWAAQAQRLDWIKPFTKVKNTNFTRGAVSIKWYEDGTLNLCAN